MLMDSTTVVTSIFAKFPHSAINSKNIRRGARAETPGCVRLKKTRYDKLK